MKCPKCGLKPAMQNQLTSSENETYRKYKCHECGRTFFTVEFEVDQTKEFKEMWDRLQKAEVKDDITRITEHYGYRCEYISNQYVYVVYNINEAVGENGKVDRKTARGYFSNSVLAERECRYLEAGKNSYCWRLIDDIF